MTVDWHGYEPYDPSDFGDARTLPRAVARDQFKRCMALKHTRLEELRSLLGHNGVDLRSSDSSIQRLNDWFIDQLEADPDRPGALLPIWYSVCRDIALFLGDVMIERFPNLRWELYTWGKTNSYFQRHVIMGFSTENPKFHTAFDIDSTVTTYAHRIVESRGSVAKYGIIVVRGVPIDVDGVADRHRAREIEADAFLDWLNTVARRNGGQET